MQTNNTDNDKKSLITPSIWMKSKMSFTKGLALH